MSDTMEFNQMSTEIQNSIAKYSCNICAKQLRTKIPRDRHEDAVSSSSNGLVSYTGYHRCNSGILELTNLDVDTNYDVRSHKNLNLPSVGLRKKVSSLGLPTPGQKNETMKIVRINNLPSFLDLKMIIMDYGFDTQTEIGRINTEIDEIQHIITSEKNTISLYYYSSSFQLTNSLKHWLRLFVNTMEEFLPSKIGILVELLLFILENCRKHPGKFEHTFLRTILSSHEIFFDVIHEWNRSTKSRLIRKYDPEMIENMLEIIAFIKGNPGKPLLQIAKITHEIDFVGVISLVLIMELEELIKIHRPGIVNLF